MEDYIQEFEILVSQAPNITEEQMKGYFLAGLQPKIRHQIRPHDPKELTRAMEIALDLEETLNWDKYATNSYRTGQFRYTGGIGVMTRSDNHKGGSRKAGFSVISDARKENRHNMVGIEGTSKNSKTLPYLEYLKRREEGRCFNCGGAYSYGHKCPDKNLRVVICGEGEDLEDEGLQHTQTEEEKEDEEESDGPNMSADV